MTTLVANCRAASEIDSFMNFPVLAACEANARNAASNAWLLRNASPPKWRISEYWNPAISKYIPNIRPRPGSVRK